MNESYQFRPDSSANNGETYYHYSRQDAIQILTGASLLLLPKLRANQAAGLSWTDNVQSLIERIEDDDAQLALYQLYRLSRQALRYPDPSSNQSQSQSNYLGDLGISWAVGLDLEELSWLVSLVSQYRLYRLQQMHRQQEPL